MKPVWFLDIDGVINAFPSPPVSTPFDFKYTEILGYPIWYAQEVVDFINRMHASGNVEVRWLTTWTDRGNSDFAPGVGIEHEFEVYPQHMTLGDYDWWKADHIRKFVTENPDTPFIWTDDDIKIHLSHAHRFDATVGDAECLVLAPFTRTGLTEEHLELIEEFVNEYQ